MGQLLNEGCGMLKRVLLVLVLAVLGLLLVVLGRTFATTSQQLPAAPFTPMAIDVLGAASRLGTAITHKTVSFQAPWDVRGDEFQKFHAFLAETYPKVHSTLLRETVAEHSLLYTWTGKEPSAPPIILLAHMDVVPVDAATELQWTQPPFEGKLVDGFVWGRGAIDDKSSIIAILEATEVLLEVGFQPKRTIYFAFGHDEELGGNAARQIAQLLSQRGVMAEFTLDEGSGITQGIVPGVSGPLALVGIAEKGYLTLELTVKGEGGHSSQPPDQTTVGILSQAVVNIEKNPLPMRLEGPMRDMLEVAGPEMSFPMRAVMANLWLFEPVIKGQFASSKTTAAALRTTTAVTMMNAGVKENVLPMEAKAVVNFRILPGDTVASITEHIKRVVNDERIAVAPLGEHETFEAGQVSSTTSAGYQLIARTARQVLPACTVAPSLVLGATDSKRYYDVSRDQYRMQPMLFSNDDLKTIHGTNEKLSLENLERAIQFYAQLFKNSGE